MATLTPAPSIVKTERFCRAPKGGVVITGKHFKGGQFCFNAPADVVQPTPAPTVPTRTSIGGFAYTLAPIVIHPEVGSVAFALAKPDMNAVYHVHRDIYGDVVCDCPDFAMCRAGSGVACKHGKALVDLGLIEPAAPSVLVPFARRTEAAAPAPRRRYEPSAEDFAYAASALGWRN